MKHPMLVAAIAFVAVVSCRPDTVGDPVTEIVQPGVTIPGQVDATVRLLRIEGGCWVLATGGRNYQPINLPADYHVDGLQVRVRFRELREAASTCQVGPIVSIEAIGRA